MKFTTAFALITTLALAACGSHDQGASPAGAPASTSSSDNGWLWGLGGFLMGRMSAPRATPAPAAAPVYVDRRTIVQAPAVPTPAPVKSPAASAAPAKTPAVTTAPRVTPPQPTMAPKPSYSGPSSYRSVTQSAPSYSRSFSSPSSGRR